MHQIAVRFDVPADRRAEFITAALEDGRHSLADEPGTRRFEVIVDKDDPNRFYLNEAYDDQAAVDAHIAGPHLARFRELIADFAGEPTLVVNGTRIEDPAAAAGTLVVVVTLRAAAGKEQQLWQALAAVVPPTLAEPGCLAYRPYTDPTDPSAMVLVEEWADRAALDRHFQTDHFRKVGEAIEPLLAEPVVIRELTPNRAG